MKNILTKFHLNITTYLFFLLCFLCGYFKPIFYIFFLLFFHELGHVFTIKLCHYQINKVEFYPFGGMTIIEKPINSSLRKEILISLSGCLAQVLMAFILYFLQAKIPVKDYQLLQSYNIILCLFNLLPIIPLDGSIFVHSLLEKFYPYQKSFFIYEGISIISFLFFLFLNWYFHMENYFIISVLLFQFYQLKKQEKYFIHRFYLERYLYNFPYRTIQNHETKDIRKLRKETLHFFKEKDHYIPEKEVLKEYFERKP